MTGFAGTWRLTGLALRRDRVALPAWIACLGLFVAATTAMFTSSLATQEDVIRETRLVATNAGMRMLGLTSGATVGGYMLHREFVTLAVLAGLMSTLAVVRHTRQNEELGRFEVVGSTVVGRFAGLAAGVIVAVLANLVLAGVLGLAIRVNGQPTVGSFLAGASVAGVGLVFTGVTAVTCQLASSTRGAIGMSGAVIGLSFLLSGVGNMVGSVDSAGVRVESAWPVWLSPIGWGQQTRPFGGDHWLPLALGVVLLAGLLALAFALLGTRDMGRGLVAQRPGPAHAKPGLLSPTGLAWRLQRSVLLGWAVALLGFGVIFGTLTEQVQDVQGLAKDWYAGMAGGRGIVEAYEASIIAIAGMFVAIYVVQVLLRIHTDETGGTVESVLATPVTRTRWVLGHVANAVGGAVGLLLVFAVAMGAAAGHVLGDTTTQIRDLTIAGLAQLPGIIVLGAAVVLVSGLAPRWSVPLSWMLLLAALVLGPMFGPGLDLPMWVQDLSPFTHIPKVPATSITITPLVGLSVLAVALATAGVVAIRRRAVALPA